MRTNKKFFEIFRAIYPRNVGCQSRSLENVHVQHQFSYLTHDQSKICIELARNRDFSHKGVQALSRNKELLRNGILIDKHETIPREMHFRGSLTSHHFPLDI